MKQFVLVGIVVTGCVQIMNGAEAAKTAENNGAYSAEAPKAGAGNGVLQRQPSLLRAARKASAVTAPFGRGAAASEAPKAAPGAQATARVPDSNKGLLPLLANLASAAPGRKGSQVNTDELAQQMAALSARTAHVEDGAGASLATEDAANEPANGITADGTMSAEEIQLLLWYKQLEEMSKGMPAILRKADPAKTAWVVQLIRGSATAIRDHTNKHPGEIDEDRFDAADDE